ncbi:hypothetical protein LWI29_025239 [Acer saccharum]|uniref:Protein kinase domain-containing protein n=1 Tax=Acer saccharum TaxID=4024 RepID=A0AA39SN14_ACESA|nr:hypothetical protein LWI29_025239 [Acer saccharum]
MYCPSLGFDAPERYLGSLNEKCDVYGFGVLLLVLLTGKSSYDEVLDYEDDGYRAGIDLADHKALVMELKHTNNDLLERQNGAGGFAKDSESLKKHIAMASSALHHVRQRNTYPEILLPPWLKARLVGNQAGYLDSSYAAQESGSAVVEIVKDSRLKAHTMVDTAIKAMSSIKEGEDAVNGIRQTLEYTDNQQMTSDSRVPVIRSPEQDGTDKNEAQVPSELITSCVSTMLMIQCDFSVAESILEGETRIKRLIGRVSSGEIGPDHHDERTDVYSFGAFLFVLLSGQRIHEFMANDRLGHENTHKLWFWEYLKKYNENNRYIEIENNRYIEIVDPRIVGNGPCLKTRQQLQAFVKLMFKCISESADDRPTKVDVAKQLNQLYLSGI